VSHKGKRIFVKIFLSYVLFMLIPFFAVGYIYNASIKSISDSSKADSYNMLFQVKNMVDTRLKEVTTISDYISKNPDLIPVLKYDKEYVHNNLLDVYKLYNSIPRFQLSNSIIDKIYVLCKNSGLTIAPGSACEYTQNLHKNLFPEINYNYDEWNDFLWNNRLPDNYVILENSSSNIHSNLVYLRGLPDALSSSHPGTLYISIKNSFFVDMLKKVDTGKKGVVCIIDDNGNVVSSFKEKGFSLDLDRVFLHLSKQTSDSDLNNYIINSVNSDLNNWTYYSIIPKNVILSQVSYVKNMIFFLTFIAFLVGCIIAYKLASQKAIVLKKIIQYLSDAPTPKTIADTGYDEYQYIESAVSNLVSNNQELNKRLYEQRDTIKASMLRTLIFGDFYDKDELNSLIDNSSFEFTNKQYAVVTISLIHQGEVDYTSSDNNYDIVHLFFKEISGQLPDNQMYILDIDDKTIAVIITFNNSLSIEKCHEFIDGIATSAYNECLLRYNVIVKFAVSFIYENISRIHKAYEQSKQISEYLLDNDKYDDYIMYASPQLLQTDIYYYPVEVELKLIQLVKYGDIHLLEDLLQEIYEENFKNRNLSQAMKKQLVFAMRGTIIRGLRNIVPNDNINKMIHELDTAVSMEDIFYYASEISLEICRIVAAKRDEDEEMLKRDIFKYIEESYSDSSFCIHNIADRFNCSENAIYQYFRENIGTPFSTVLENKRIEKACELMRDTDMQIKDVALSVGYNNDITFRRAFKRVMGVLPLEYKKTFEIM
jgi:two-component system response regulator YesN